MTANFIQFSPIDSPKRWASPTTAGTGGKTGCWWQKFPMISSKIATVANVQHGKDAQTFRNYEKETGLLRSYAETKIRFRILFRSSIWQKAW
jgi:hypothetical protein